MTGLCISKNVFYINPFTAATRNSLCIKLQLIIYHQNNFIRLLNMHFFGTVLVSGRFVFATTAGYVNLFIAIMLY